MSRFRKLIAILLLAAVLLLLVLLPKHMTELMDRTGWLDWLRPKDEAFRGVITVMHVASVRPYLGSLGNWVKKYASKLEKKHYGVYFNVTVLSETEAEARIANGEKPDIICFPAGFVPASSLAVLDENYPSVDTSLGMADGSLRAVPIAASCRLLIFDPAKLSPDEAVSEEKLEAAKENSIEAFRRGRTDCCIADVRAAGDLERMLSSGKTGYFDVLAFEEHTDLVQYVGISASADPKKLNCCREFISLLTGDTAQAELTELGLLPMNTSAELRYEQAFLNEAYALIRSGGSDAYKNAFGDEKRNDE